MDALDTLRAQYRAIRNACTLLDAKRFDTLCLYKASELADGEAVTPANWVQAAREISSDVVYLSADDVNDIEMRDG